MQNLEKKFVLLAVLVSICSLGLTNSVVQARPSYSRGTGNSCSASFCHSSVTGRMEVANEDAVNDLGQQLDGSTRGPVKTFVVNAGSTATLSVTVLNGADKYAAQLKRLETGGQLNGVNNQLGWNEANAPANIWTRQEDTNPPYFTKDAGNDDGISWGGQAITYNFDLLVDASTPADFYDLAFVVSGKDGPKWTQEEHFYLQVLAGLVGDLNGDGFVGIADLDIVLGNWNQNVPPGDPLADPSGDGFVGIADLDVVLGNWNAGTPPGAEVLALVPEPGTVGLLVLGGLWGFGWRRARRG